MLTIVISSEKSSDFDEIWYTADLDLRQSRDQNEQEVQLSQRDRATLRVIEYFAKSLKVTQTHSKRHCRVGRV